MPKDQSYIDDDFSFSSDSGDDAPSEVKTSNVRNKKLSQVRSIRQQDKKSKEKEKDKRRKRDEMFKAQKEQKLKTFGKRALPEDVLEAISAKNTKLNEENEGDNGDVSNDEEDRLNGNNSDEDDLDNGIFGGDEDFIALDSSLKIVTVKGTGKNKSCLENALAFRNNRLYHTQGLAPPRETANQRRNRMQKKKQLCVK